MTARATRFAALRPHRPAAPGQVPGRPRQLGRVLWCTLVVITVLGFGLVASRSAHPSEPGRPQGDVAAAKQVINLIVHPEPGRDPVARLPDDFARVSGVRAARSVTPDGLLRAEHVGGGCSTPWGDDDTRWNFGAGCRAHDLGYDLLRYADRKGHPLGQDIRQRLDDRLSADMHDRCETNPRGAGRACHLVASLYTAGMVLNSWHQRWGPPTGAPIGPWVTGLLVVGVLLAARLRGWLRPRRRESRAARSPAAAAPRHPAASARAATPVWVHPAGSDRSLALLRVVSIVGLMCGAAVFTLARTAGVGIEFLWPLTWLCQLSLVFYWAGGQANLHSWRAVRATGGGYGQYLAGRVGWLSRPVLALVLAWLAVPLSLELLGVHSDDAGALASVTTQPLWLLGGYLIAVAATPVMAWMHQLRPNLTLACLAAGVVALGLGWQLPATGLTGGLLLALLAQQAGFRHADSVSRAMPARRLLVILLLGSGTLLGTLGWNGGPWVLLSPAGSSPVLGASVLPVLLLGACQLAVLGLLRRPLHRVAATPGAWRMIAFTRTAPMTLYLGFLAALLMVVALVHLPDAVSGVSWVLRPRPLAALALLAAPALLAFMWGERHDGFRWSFGWHPPEVASLNARLASVLGAGYVLIGVFGFAYAGFTAGYTPTDLFGLSLDPLQNVIHLVLGWFLLHTLRTTSSERPSTWLLTTLACVPPLMSAAQEPEHHQISIGVHASTAMVALSVMITLAIGNMRERSAHPATVR